MTGLKITFRVFLFFGGLVALNFGANMVFDPIDTNSEYARSLSSRMDRIDLNGDVLFIGDSRTHQGLAPRVFEAAVRDRSGKNVRAVNLGRPGMQLPFYYYSLQNYLTASEGPPDAIFINISYHILFGREWMESIYLIGFQPSFAQMKHAISTGLLSRTAALHWYIRTRVPLLRLRKAFKNVVMQQWAADPLDLTVLLDGHDTLETTLYGGGTGGYFSRGSEHIDPVERQDWAGFRPGLADPVLLQYLSLLIELARAHDIALVIYEFPWTEAQNADGYPETIESYQRLISKIADGHDHVTVHWEDYFWDHKLFIDPLHLNEPGARKLSERAADWYLDLGE